MARRVVAIALPIAAMLASLGNGCGKERPSPTPDSSSGTVHALGAPVAGSLDELACDDGVVRGNSSSSAATPDKMRGEIAGALPLAEPIARAICAGFPHLAACWRDARTLDPSIPAADYVAAITVGANGKIERARAVSPVRSPPFSQCALTDLVGLKLPTDTPAGEATYTLHLPQPAVNVAWKVVGGSPYLETEKGVHASDGDVRACYEKALRRDASIAGTIVMQLTIDDKGVPHPVTTTAGTLTDAETIRCVFDVFSSLGLPGISASLTYSIDFSHT